MINKTLASQQKQMIAARKNFLRYWQRLKHHLDGDTNEICRRVEYWFQAETKHFPQGVWCYVGAVKMFDGWLEMQRHPRHSRPWDLAKGNFQFWRNQLTRDLHQWAKTS